MLKFSLQKEKNSSLQKFNWWTRDGLSYHSCSSPALKQLYEFPHKVH